MCRDIIPQYFPSLQKTTVQGLLQPETLSSYLVTTQSHWIFI